MNVKINSCYSKSIPKVVRLATNSQIIYDYVKMCTNNDLKPISESYCYKILSECSASFSKGLQGLDNMYADGLDAFEKLSYNLNSLKESCQESYAFSELTDLVSSCEQTKSI